MWGRLTSWGFLVGLVLAMWYQRVYIRDFTQEMMMAQGKDRSHSVAMEARGVRLQFVRKSLPESSGSADRVTFRNDGQVEMEGDVRLRRYDLKGQMSAEFLTGKASGKIEQIGEAGDSFIEAKRNLELATIPGSFLIRTLERSLSGQTMSVDFIGNVAKSEHPIQVKGPGDEMSGKGFVYHIDTGLWEMKGPVTGGFTPQAPKGEGK